MMYILEGIVIVVVLVTKAMLLKMESHLATEQKESVIRL